MKLFHLLQLPAALGLLALAGTAQFSADDDGDPGLQAARGMWFESANLEDSREVLVGHIMDDNGNKVITMVATLRPDGDSLQVEKRKSGLMYGELRLADEGGLSSAVSELFQPDPGIERKIEIVGRWERRTDGLGHFDALVTWGGHVIIGSLRGVYGPDLVETLQVPPLSQANPLSHSNPFGAAVVGGPLTTILLPADPYGLQSANDDGILPSDPPFSTPERSVEAGDFVAELELYTL